MGIPETENMKGVSAKWSLRTRPAMQSNSRCRQVSHLPHKQPRRPRDPSAPPEPSQRLLSAKHAKQNARQCRQVPGLAMQNEGRWRHQAPRLPRKHPRRPRDNKRSTRAIPVPYVPHLPRRKKVDVAKGHACHAEWRSMSPSATPATENEDRRRQVSHLPHKTTAATTGHKHATRAIQVPQAPRLPRKMRVDVTKCHACHAKWKITITKRHACHWNLI